MARETKVARLWPSANGFPTSWTALGSATNAEEVAQTSVLAEAKPNEARGITNSVKGGNQRFRFTAEAEAKLPATGARIIGIKLWYYGKPSSAKLTASVNNAATPVFSESVEAGSTTLGWRSIVVSAPHVATTTLQHFLTNQIEVGFINEKATASTINECYLEVEYETETAQPIGTPGAAATTGPGGGGTRTITVPSRVSGVSVLVAIQASGGVGATEVTDSGGNTYTLDGEAVDGTATCVQLWKTITTAGLGGAPTITVALPSALAGLAVNVGWAEFTPMVSASSVDTTGKGEGEGTSTEATTSANLRAQGDLLIGVTGITGTSSVLTAGSGMTALTGVGQTGGSLGWEYNLTPTAGSKAKPAATMSVTGAWAMLAVAYKVLATEGGSTPQNAKSTIASTFTVVGSARISPSARATIASVETVVGSAKLGARASGTINSVSAVLGSARTGTRAAASIASVGAVLGSAHTSAQAKASIASTYTLLGSARTGKRAAATIASTYTVLGSARTGVRAAGTVASTFGLSLPGRVAIRASATIGAVFGVIGNATATSALIAKSTIAAVFGLSKPVPRATLQARATVGSVFTGSATAKTGVRASGTVASTYGATGKSKLGQRARTAIESQFAVQASSKAITRIRATIAAVFGIKARATATAPTVETHETTLVLAHEDPALLILVSPDEPAPIATASPEPPAPSVNL